MRFLEGVVAASRSNVYIKLGAALPCVVLVQVVADDSVVVVQVVVEEKGKVSASILVQFGQAPVAEVAVQLLVWLVVELVAHSTIQLVVVELEWE